MTTAIDRPEAVADPRLETTEERRGGLGVAVVILTVIVVILGAWILYDYSQRSATAASPEMVQLLDDYTTAWNDHDAEAFLALTTEGYVFTAPGGMEFNRADQGSQLETTLPAFTWQVEELGDPIMVGSNPYYVAKGIHTVTNIREADGISILTVEDIDGTLKVARHIIVGDY